MNTKFLKSFLLITLLFSLTNIVFAADSIAGPENILPGLQTPQSQLQKGKPLQSQPAPKLTQYDKITEIVPPVSCDFQAAPKPDYSAQFLSVRKKGLVAKKELFETEVFVTNLGNEPWFSTDSGCGKNIVNLGTDYDRDRASVFAPKNLIWESNWQGENRIKLDNKRVDPGQIATFTFWNQAPEQEGVYREYFTPVMEGVKWLDGGAFGYDVTVGNANIDPALKDTFAIVQKSINLSTLNFSGEKNIEVDISSQRLFIKIGDTVVRTFIVSTGLPRTPTPISNNLKILIKQEVRVAASTPHYIMPKYMMFKAGGYGFHALPSLANDRGVFWREALNHIGTPRSHGCIRLLPQDAALFFNWAEIGTKVAIHS